MHTADTPGRHAQEAGDAEHPFLHALCAFRPLVSATHLHDLVRSSPSPEAAWNAPEETLRKLGWTREQRTQFLAHRNAWQPARRYERLREQEIALLPYGQEAFPALLKEIHDPPLALYVRGTLPPDNRLTLAFVGSRKATPYGKTAVNMLVRPLAARGAAIISGLAYGIDAEAHRATLAVRGTAVAVLGGGVDDAALYPRAHRGLANDIIASGGAVISEFPPGTPPVAHHFPQRNRVIAGLSRGIVIVEAAERSGALITARLGLEQNRDVFVVPGPITSPASAGTNALLREGAAPVRSAEDIMESLELTDLLAQTTRERDEEVGDAADDRATLLRVITRDPQSLDEIVQRSTLAPNVVASLITVLELDGCVRDVGGRNYVRV